MSNFLRFRGCPSANVLEYAMLPHDKKQLPIAAPHDQSVLYGLKKFSSTPGVAPKEQQERDRAKNPCELCGILARPFTGCPRRLAQPVDRRVVPRVRTQSARAQRVAEESHWAAPEAPAGARHASMASQLARGFLAEQDLERFVR